MQGKALENLQKAMLEILLQISHYLFRPYKCRIGETRIYLPIYVVVSVSYGLYNLHSHTLVLSLVNVHFAD